jgi:hypothetical protein
LGNPRFKAVAKKQESKEMEIYFVLEAKKIKYFKRKKYAML